MIFALRDPQLGFISGKEGFTDVKDINHFRESEIFLNESTFYDNPTEIDSIKNEKRLVKQFHEGIAWGDIYVNPDYQ